MTNYNKDHPALSRFFENLPDYPRCTDKLEAGCRRSPKHVAIKRRYIELNKENYSVTYLPYDCDSPIGMLMWHIRSLPPPTLSVSNWDNFRSHLTWELSIPVHLGGKNPSQRAINYLDVVRRGFTQALDADPSFGGLLTKNPFSDFWFVDPYDKVYDLDELAEAVRDITLPKKKSSKKLIEVSPDDSLFVYHNIRWYMYTITPDCSRHGELYDKADVYVRELSTDFSLNLPESKIRSNAKSISKFCCNHRDDFIANRAAFIEIQRQRAYRSHKARKRNNANKISNARRKLRKAGQTITKAAISQESGISTRTLSERRLKTDLSEIRSANAHQTADIKRAVTEAKIKQAFTQALREGIKPTQSNIARLSGVSLRTVKRHWHKLSDFCQ